MTDTSLRQESSIPSNKSTILSPQCKITRKSSSHFVNSVSCNALFINISCLSNSDERASIYPIADARILFECELLYIIEVSEVNKNVTI